MDNLKWYLCLLIATLSLGALGYFRLSSGKTKVMNLNREGIKTYGIVTNKFKGIDYTYSVGSEVVRIGQRTRPRGLLDGEIFEVIYDKNFPSQSIINFHKPFIDTVNYDVVCASFLASVGNNSLIKIKYFYNNRLYERYHVADLSKFRSQGPYKVLVNREKPEQSYLIDDKCS